MLEPIFEADLRSSSYGFRPKRSATEALETLRTAGARGGNHALDAYIRDYFARIDYGGLMTLVAGLGPEGAQDGGSGSRRV